MEENKNLCAQILLSLHEKVTEERISLGHPSANTLHKF